MAGRQKNKTVRSLPLQDNQIYRLEINATSETKEWRDRFGIVLSGMIPDVLNEGSSFWLYNSANLAISGKSSIESAIIESDGYEHNTDAPFLSVRKTTSFLELETGNMVGKLVVPKPERKNAGSVSVEVSSRFGGGFLRFIISDAHGFLKIDEFGSQTSTETGWEWLLGYLWATKLKSTVGRLGIPKSYVSWRERTTRPRGIIDPIDWIAPKTPGRWLATMREHSFNTAAAKLFLLAYDLLARRENVKSMGFLADLRFIIHELKMATSGDSLPICELLKVQPFRNPFYRDYDEIIDLSKKIVRGFGAVADDAMDSQAFLFDVSMLFEYFIRNRLKRFGIPLKTKEADLLDIPHGGKYNSGRRKLIPDIVIDDSSGHCFIYDVKYKYWDERFGVNREDLFQLHTYVGRYSNDSEVIGCGFVYPIPENRLDELSVDETIKEDGRVGIAIKSNQLKIGEHEIPFHVVFLVIPEESQYSIKQEQKTWAEQFDCNVEKLTEYFANGIKLGTAHR